MKAEKTLFILLLLIFTISGIAQKTAIKIDISSLDLGEVQVNTLGISSSSTFSTFNNEKVLTVEAGQLPTLMKLSILNKHKLIDKKMIWVFNPNVKIEGPLENSGSLKILPENDEQIIADKIFIKVAKGQEVNDDLAFSKPYLVYLAQEKQFYGKDYINRILTSMPDQLKNFWAYKVLNKYLKDLEQIGYDAENKHFTYLTAINKLNEEQKFEMKDDKNLLIDFSFSGCPPCIVDIDKLVKLNKELNDQLDILTVWNESDYEIWINSSKKQKDKITWLSLMDKNGSVIKAFGVKVFPTYILINKNGDVLKKWTGKFPKNIKKHL